MRRLIIWPAISRRIGACGLTHEGLPVFLNGLRSDLENHYHIYCVLRDEEEHRFFHYLVARCCCAGHALRTACGYSARLTWSRSSACCFFIRGAFTELMTQPPHLTVANSRSTRAGFASPTCAFLINPMLSRTSTSLMTS